MNRTVPATSDADVGTLAWARRTRGRLTPSQAFGQAAAQITQQVHRWRTPGTPGPASDAADRETGIAETDAAEEIVRYATAHLPAPILNHSWRVWVWANVLRPGGSAVNPDLLVAASLLHDVGLTTGRGDHSCFTVRSADIAADVLGRIGFGTGAVEAVAAAIIGHMNPVPPPGADGLTRTLHAATHLDVVGAQAHRIPDALIESTQRRYPRDGFPGCFSAGFRREFVHAPLTRAGVAWLAGLPLAVRLNPIA